MIYKHALCDLIPLDASNVSGVDGLIKTASGKVLVEPNSEKARIIEAEVKKHPTALFFRSKAIKADEPNSNGDFFSEDELIKHYKSFEGVPFFTNHDNQNIENARGKVIYAEWVPAEKSVYVISFIDREAYPHICRSIEEEYVNGVSMGAISGDSVITMYDLTEKKISDVVIGDKVMTPYGNAKEVINIHSEYLGKPMYRFEMVSYHKSPLFTEDHPIYSIEGAQVEAKKLECIKLSHANGYCRRMGRTEEFVGQDGWRKDIYSPRFTEASKVSVGDYLLIPSRFSLTKGHGDSSDFYYVVGAFLGDGYLKKDKNGKYEGVSFCLGLDEIELAKKITDILKKYTSFEPCNIVCEERNGLYLTFYDRELAKWFSDNVGTGSKTKRLKFQLQKEDDAMNLLAGYMDTDGCISKKTNAKHTSAYQISSANISLLEDIQSLLIALGSVSRISSFGREPGKNSVVKVHTIEHTLAIGSMSAGLFKESIKFNNSNSKTAKINAGKTFITKIGDRNLMACRVKSVAIEDLKEPVYDLTVDGDESYIADGIGVHNCSVEYSVCSICENRAEKADDFCTHIKNRKGRKFSGKVRNVRTGETKDLKDELIYEKNYGIKFIELSAVVDPACPSCRIEGIITNDEYLKKVANLQNSMYMIKTAAMHKNASQQEVDQLNQVLQTLEAIAVSLIQNRQQVEVEFASDLVTILSDLQVFVDELIGAGYGKLQNVPGVGAAPAGAEGLDPSLAGGSPVGATPVSQETAVDPMAAGAPPADVGSVSGSPTKPMLQAPASPNLPIMAPIQPKASNENKMLKIAELVSNLKDKVSSIGEDDMAKRRTNLEKNEQKKIASEVLSNLWQGKRAFLEYINRVPSIQDNNNKLSVKKRDDSFIIVAENKVDENIKRIWTYEDLTNDEKNIIKKSPKEASMYFLGAFANNFVNQIKEGERRMTNTIKEAGASSINKNLDVVTESQLDASGIYHPRTGKEVDEVFEKQLESLRTNADIDDVTEKQLAGKGSKLNPRTEKVTDEVEESQLEPLRENKDIDVVTQSQLEGSRTNTDTDDVTEKQLNSVDAPWARAAKRDAKLFKGAGDHLKAIVDVMADTVIATGCTPSEMRAIASSLISSTKDRYELVGQMLTKADSSSVDFSKRLAYWGQKNMKIASVSGKEIAAVFIGGLRAVASDTTINPDVMIDAIDVVCEDEVGIQTVGNRIDEKLASVKEEIVKVSHKEELRNALRSPGKEKRDEDRKEILASVAQAEVKSGREIERKDWESKTAAAKTEVKKADTVIETSFDEMGIDKTAKRDSSFKSAIRQFAKGALASQGIKMASVVNVTVSNETVSIAVKTDNGDESVEIPIGEKTEPDDSMPEGDMTGEGLENQLGATPPAPTSGMGAPPAPTAPAGAPPALASSGKKMQKAAQMGGVGGGVPGTPGGKAGGPGAPEAAIPGAMPEEQPVEALTTDTPEAGAEDVSDEIPTAGEQQMPYAICPECGSSDADVDNVDGNIKGKCNKCGAEWEALIKKEIEFKILKPTKSIGKEGVEEVESPEVPSLPVAAQTRLDKDGMIRVASNRQKHGHVCPACGMNQCKASVDTGAHAQYTCPACSTAIEKDVIVNVNNPKESYLRVKWDVVPKVAGCDSCKEGAKKFASMLKVEKMMKSAMGNTAFPMANCVELVARKWGGNAVSTFGPCKGKPLAPCVCNQLKTFAMTKVRHMEKLASVSMQQDPMNDCIKDHMKKDFSRKEASNLCGCLKKKFAKEADDNIFIQAFKDDVDSGKETELDVDDLRVMNEVVSAPEDVEIVDEVGEEADVDMGDVDLTPSEVTIDIDDEEAETVTLELPKDAVEALAAAAQDAVAEEVVPEEVAAEEAEVSPEVDTEAVDIEIEPVEGEVTASMQTHKLRRVGDVVVKLAGKPTKVETIEKDVEAGVPRGKATIGNEGKDNIDVAVAKPSVPRGKATIGNEGADNIDVTIELPDVTVDGSYMGSEKELQKGMPAINNEIKGTVIAKKLKEVETVEKDVEAGVPRGKATIGNEGKDNIDVAVAKPSVPRGKATIGNEGKDNIDVAMDAPDVPVGDAYMGAEKEVQKGMPANNDEMLKNVAKKRDIQLERIAGARRMKAVEVASKLLATARIAEGAYENVVDALAAFEIDKISSVAENMYPKRMKTASTTQDSSMHSGTAIVIEAKAIEHADDKSLAQKLASQFTIGSRDFDAGLQGIGEK